eukprot:3458826-Pleurochrysis_carterae.AAC.1
MEGVEFLDLGAESAHRKCYNGAGVSFLKKDLRCEVSTVGRVFNDVFTTRVPRGTQKVHGSAHQLVRLVEFTGVLRWNVRASEDVFAVAYRGRSSVRSRVGREEARDRKGGTRRRGDDCGVRARLAALEQVLIDGVE